jgi:hypothetical protein
VERAREKKLTEPQPVWQEGIGSLLLLAAAHQTGFLAKLGTTMQGLASAGCPSGLPLNLAVIERLVLTLLFLPVAGLARTWDLRTYTGTMLALLTGRGCAYSYAYVEQFLSRLAHTGADERLTDAVAQWTWALWHAEHTQQEQEAQEQEEHRAVFYVDGHRKAVYSDVLVPRGPVGKLGGKILGCRELVVLHDDEGHPLLATTHRGDQHLTRGAPQLLHRYEQAIDLGPLDSLVVDREGMAAEFLFQLHTEGRRVVTLLRSNQYKDEGSFTEVGEWLPWRLDRQGSVVCEVAAAQFHLPRSTQPDQPLMLRVGLIRDGRKLIVCEAATEAETDEGEQWTTGVAPDHPQFWEPDWQATPAPPAPTRPKLIPVVTTATEADAVELAHTYFRRWNCQENAIRDWLIPLNLDTNHGYAKEPVVNSELVKRRAVLEKRVAHVHRLAAESRKRLRQMRASDQVREEQVVSWEHRQQELLAQVRALETLGQSDEPGWLAIKAQQVEAEWEVHHRRVLLAATSVAGQRELNHCARSCRALRHVLRQQEDLRTYEREMRELDNTKDQIMTLLKVGLANLGMWVRDHYFAESYQSCGWERLVPFFQLSGWVTATETEVRLDFSPFNHRAMGRDLQELCRTVNTSEVHLPDGRRLVLTAGQRRSGCLNGPLANTG